MAQMDLADRVLLELSILPPSAASAVGAELAKRIVERLTEVDPEHWRHTTAAICDRVRAGMHGGVVA